MATDEAMKSNAKVLAEKLAACAILIPALPLSLLLEGKLEQEYGVMILNYCISPGTECLKSHHPYQTPGTWFTLLHTEILDIMAQPSYADPATALPFCWMSDAPGRSLQWSRGSGLCF